MGLSVIWHNQTIARRISLSFHSQEVTSQGVLMRVSSSAAERSSTILVSLCCWNSEPGRVSVQEPSMMALAMAALSSPHDTMITLRAFMMVEIPMVMVLWGVFSFEL